MTEIFLTDELTDQDKLDELRIIREKSINFGANINPIESAKNLPQSFIDVISKTVWVSFVTSTSRVRFPPLSIFFLLKAKILGRKSLRCRPV